ncbi:peroxisome membrane protein [Gloeophyllum trabeum ATCC 11539]|uniref:Peroxisomal membrane protein PEX16 n=1 Tax=Gloeophyllum trabeum (strain ATCC 11539 / FP-39264 / Madison 617) TaxID=670483 RepID=S7S013_GLOTA|nr:peroxisome membrane protein [Gloeophyllum trabeum ATCC 11539]EPQ60675.1 peroxisome membrane protein [Gloeophyllum trabeum ATCC 11539]
MSSAIARYESFLIHNVSTISSVESTIRSLSWFLPGRFKDAELASEALVSLLNTLSLYHDTLLSRIIHNDPKYRPLIPSSLHSRYTRAWSDRDNRYKWAARALELIRFVELVIEMGLKRKASAKNKWRGIVLLESIKAVLRLVLLRITRRPLVTPPIPEREFDPSTLPPSNTSSPTLAPSSPRSSSPISTPDHLKNNHTALPPHTLLTTPPPLSMPSPVEDYLLPKALTISAVKTPTALMKTLSSPKDWLAEVIYAIRPLIYAVLLSRDPHSNQPFMTSIMIEILSRNLRRTPSPSSELERAEYARRDRHILWYLLRGSIWREFTRPKLETFVDKTANIPLLNLFGSVVQAWIPLINEYYYYTAP